MKIYMIVCLIAAVFLKQGHHHLFWITGLNLPQVAFSLASEEFIPQESTTAPPIQNAESNEQTSFPYNDGLQISQSNPSDVETEKDKPHGSSSVNSEENIKIDVISNDRVIPTQVPVVNDVHDESNPVDSLNSESENLSFKQVHLDVETLATSVDNIDVVKGHSDVNVISEETISEDVSSSQASAPEGGSAKNVSSEPEKPKPAVPSSPPQEEEPIPSFLEWTQLQQKKLQELHAGGSGSHAHTHNGGAGPTNPSSGGGQHQNQQNGNNGVNVSAGIGNAAKKDTDSSSATKNFASPDCGAKVIQSNPGSQNPNGVLSSSHDEYMLNKCGVPIWFVIELCEPLKIEKVALGNLELFSSSPKEFELGISDRFPAREWNKLGPFPLPDARSIHPLTLPATNSSTFGKFLKVNILSHHGTEHYCPLSVVKVNGKSEYEVLESETTHAEDEEESNKEESSLFEEELEEPGDGKTNEKSVFGSATDAVFNIVKKAAQALAKTDTATGSDSWANISDQPIPSLNPQCQTTTHCIPSDDPKALENINNFLSCNSSDLLPFLLKNLFWCGWERCHAVFSRSSIGTPWQPEGFYAGLFGGPNILLALCHFLQPLRRPCDVYIENNKIIGVAELPTKDADYANLSLNTGLDSVPMNTSTESVVRATSTPPATNDEQQVPPPILSPTPPIEPVTENGVETSQIPAPPVMGENQVDDSQGQQQFQASYSQQQKESVFVRLSNRIKTLERNQSLTASYLEELSRRFKKQSEDNHHLNEVIKKQLNDTQEKSKYMEILLRTELQSVRRNMEDMRERLFTVQIQRSLLILICLGQFIIIFFVCLWMKRSFTKLEKSIAYGKEFQQQTKQFTLGNLAACGRKRANSDVTVGSTTTKVKKIKKKKKSMIPNADITSDSAFNFKPPSNSSSFVDIIPRKENVNPLKPSSPSNANIMVSTRPSSLKYELNSDVSSQNSFGRFGILASPGPSDVFSASSGSYSGPEKSLSTMNPINNISSVNSGSNSASSSSSTVISSGVSVITTSSNGSSKKTKRSGFKSLMPKIFDR